MSTSTKSIFSPHHPIPRPPSHIAPKHGLDVLGDLVDLWDNWRENRSSAEHPAQTEPIVVDPATISVGALTRRFHPSADWERTASSDTTDPRSVVVRAFACAGWMLGRVWHPHNAYEPVAPKTQVETADAVVMGATVQGLAMAEAAAQPQHDTTPEA